jgi:integrase/recombinase XerD
MERSRPDLPTAVAAFLSTLEERGRSAATRRAYASDLRQLTRWAGRRAALPRLHQYASSLLLAELEDGRPSKRSLVRRASAYRTFLKVLNSQGWAGPPPALPGPGPIQPTDTDSAALSEAELIRLLAAPAQELHELRSQLAARRAAGAPIALLEHAVEDRVRDRALMELAFTTGLSLSEVLDLRFADFDLGQRRLRVRGRGARNRTLAFANKSAEDSIRAYLLLRAKKRRVTSHLFVNRRGRGLHANATQNAFRRYAQRAKIRRGASFRSLRQSFIQRLRQRGVDYGLACRLLGRPLPGPTWHAEPALVPVPPALDPCEGR